MCFFFQHCETSKTYFLVFSSGVCQNVLTFLSTRDSSFLVSFFFFFFSQSCTNAISAYWIPLHTQTLDHIPYHTFLQYACLAGVVKSSVIVLAFSPLSDSFIVKYREKERRMTLTKGPWLGLNRGRCSDMVCVLTIRSPGLHKFV